MNEPTTSAPNVIVPPPPGVCTTCGNPVKPGETCTVDGTVAP